MPLARTCLTLSLIAALPLAAAGCGKRACFQWSELEGSCPSQEEAELYFQGPPGCEDAVRSIDSEPEFDGEFCCYDVTTGDADEILCSEGSGTAGSGGSGGVGGASPGPSTTVSTGTGPQACATCFDLLFGVSSFPCESSSALLDELLICICSEACAGSCASSCGIPFSPDDPCLTCVQSDAGCSFQFNQCASDTGF